MNRDSDELSNRKVLEYLHQLEQRIERIETHLNLSEAKDTEPVEEIPAFQEEDALEYRIGQFWLAKIGIVVLAIGVVFLLTFPYQNLPPVLPSLFGYFIAAALFGLSYYLRDSISYIARYFLGGGLVLVYFSTMRLYFFSSQPVLSNLTTEILLLIFVAALNLGIALRRRSAYLTAVGLTLGYITLILSNHPYFIFGMISLLAALTIYFTHKFNWRNLIFLGIALSYFTHLNWFINNPLLGNDLKMLSAPTYHVYFLLIYAVIFAAGSYYRNKKQPEDDILIASTVLNGLGCFVLYFLITILKMKTELPFYHFIAAIVFIAMAILFWLKEKSKYSTFTYNNIYTRTKIY